MHGHFVLGIPRNISHGISRLLWAPKPVILTRNPSIDPDFKRGSSGRELRYEGVKWLILRARVSSFASCSPFPFPANVVDVRDRNGEELRGVVCVTNGTHPTPPLDALELLLPMSFTFLDCR